MSDTRRLALELHEIRQLALGHATNPQFGNSSVDGEGLSFRDGDGNEIGRIGGGENGMEVEYTYGPKPLMPSTPIVTADANLLLVQWDGQWAGGNEDGDAVADPDLASQAGLDRVEVHVSMEPTFVPDPILSFAGVLPVTPEGGAHTVGPLAEAGDYYVVLMARGKDGQYSAPSQRVHVVTTVGLMENELFDLALRADEARESADGKNTVHYGEEPVAPDGGFSEGDLWFDTTEDPETGFRKNMPHLWDPSANDGEGGWVSAADSRVDAVRDAQDELREDVERIVTDGAGATTYWLPAEPDETTDPTPKLGDLWFNTADGNKLSRHDGQGWVPAADERVQTIQDAMDDFESDLNTVRDTADGKNRTFYQSTMPATPPARAGDLWFNTANGYRLHRNNGATFIEVADGRIAEVEDAVENIDISGPLSEARTEWLADAAADAQQKAQNAADTAEAAARLYADQIASGIEDVDLEGFKDYADNAAEQARQAAIDAAIAEARVIANNARDEALASALDADAVISQTIAQFESDLDLVRESADGKSKITWSPNAPSGDGKAGDTWFRTSSNRIIGYWRHSGSSWVSMSLDATVIPNLDAGKITSGFIDAERFEAGSIAASSIAVGDFSNLATIDPIRDVNVTRPSSWATETVDGYITPKATSQNYLMFKDRTDTVPFKGGDRLRIEFKAVAEVDVDAAIRLWGYPDPADGGASGNYGVTGNHVRIGTTEQSFTAYVTIPDTFGVEKTLRSWIFGLGPAGGSDLHRAGVRDVTAYRMTGATLIQDGAITTEKITAGAVGATAIAAESIDASKIVAGGIQADSLIVPGTVGSTLIKDGAVTTSKIEAGAITAQSGIIASLDAGVISSGTIDTARLAAGSITSDKLLVGSLEELAPSPAVYSADWELSGGAVFFEWISSYDGVGLRLYSGSRALGPYRSTSPGRSVHAEAWAWQYGGLAADVDLNIRLYFYDRDRAYITSLLAAAGSGAVSGSAVAPDRAVYVRIGLLPTATFEDGWLSVRDIHGSPQMPTTLIEGGAITTEKIAVGAITAESGVIGSLDAGKITVGEMDGARIQAGTVAASSIAVGDFSNLATIDPVRGVNVTRPAGWATITDGDYTKPAPSSQQNYLMLKDRTNTVPFGEGDELRVKFRATSPSALQVRANLWGYPELEDGSTAGVTSAASPVVDLKAGEHEYTTHVKIPAGFGVDTPLKSWILGLSSVGTAAMYDVGVRSVSVYRKSGATLIQDGAITTDKIAVGAITAESGIIGSLDAGVITTGELRGELIRAQSIAGESLAVDAIDGKTITGATVRTSSAGARVEMDSSGLFVKNSLGANTVSMTNGTLTMLGGTITGGTIRTHTSGARVQLDTGGLKAWNPSNKETFSISANTGSVSMTGDLFQENDYGDIAIGPRLFNNSSPSLRFRKTGEAAEGHAGLTMFDGGGRSVLMLYGAGSNTSSQGRVSLQIPHGQSTSPAGLYRYRSGSTIAHLRLDQDGQAVLAGNAGESYVRVGDGGGQGIYIRTLGDLTMYGSGSKAMDIRKDSRSAFFQSNTIYYRTYSSAANLYITGSQVIGRTTSARRYKLDEAVVEAPEFEDALLSIPFKSWVDKAQKRLHDELVEFRAENPMCPPPEHLQEAPDELPRHIGAVAEDFVDAGLDSFVTYDQYRRVDGLQYDRIGPALIPVVRRLRDRVNELERMMGEMANA